MELEQRGGLKCCPVCKIVNNLKPKPNYGMITMLDTLMKSYGPPVEDSVDEVSSEVSAPDSSAGWDPLTLFLESIFPMHFHPPFFPQASPTLALITQQSSSSRTTDAILEEVAPLSPLTKTSSLIKSPEIEASATLRLTKQNIAS